MSLAPRIVCVTDPLGPGAGTLTMATCLQAVSALQDQREDIAVDVGVLGISDAGKLAVQGGISPAWRIPVPCGNLRLAERSLERMFDRQPASVVLAFGTRAAQLVSRLAQHTPLVVVLDAPCEAKHVRHAELCEVLCMSEYLADQASAAGWLPIRIRSVSPAMPTWQHVPSMDRNSLRRAWSACDDDFVIGVLPLSADSADALFAFHAMGRFVMAGHGAHLVLDPSLGNSHAVRSFARKLNLNERVHFDSAIACPWKISPAVDLWVSLHDFKYDETALHPCSAAALGAPILAQSGSFAAAAIEHQVDGLIAGEGVNACAFEMIHAAKNPALLAKIVSAARVKYATKNVRAAFALAIRESVQRVCPEALA
ncbi:MAG: hypothetical protein EXS12_06400 [Phycisphaerales bacterium]|nr:hypothetical protein [Phycisphaerales bacterium]